MAVEKCSCVGFMLSEREVVVAVSADVNFRVDPSEKRFNMIDN